MPMFARFLNQSSMAESLLKVLGFIVLTSGQILSHAALTWSGCETMAGARSYIPTRNAVVLALSPGIVERNAFEPTGAVVFQVGQEGATSNNIPLVVQA